MIHISVVRTLTTGLSITSSKLHKKKTGVDATENLRAMGKLKREVEKAKRTLSSQQSTCLEIESFEGGNDFSDTCNELPKLELTIHQLSQKATISELF